MEKKWDCGRDPWLVCSWGLEKENSREEGKESRRGKRKESWKEKGREERKEMRRVLSLGGWRGYWKANKKET